MFTLGWSLFYETHFIMPNFIFAFEFKLWEPQREPFIVIVKNKFNVDYLPWKNKKHFSVHKTKVHSEQLYRVFLSSATQIWYKISFTIQQFRISTSEVLCHLKIISRIVLWFNKFPSNCFLNLCHR